MTGANASDFWGKKEKNQKHGSLEFSRSDKEGIARPGKGIYRIIWTLYLCMPHLNAIILQSTPARSCLRTQLKVLPHSTKLLRLRLLLRNASIISDPTKSQVMENVSWKSWIESQIKSFSEHLIAVQYLGRSNRYCWPPSRVCRYAGGKSGGLLLHERRVAYCIKVNRRSENTRTPCRGIHNHEWHSVSFKTFCSKMLMSILNSAIFYSRRLMQDFFPYVLLNW